MAIFSWFKKKDQTGDPTKVQARRPIDRDFTEGLVANGTLTKQLYHNKYPGMKLAGGLVYPMIAIPVFFMGFPAATVNDDEQTQDVLDLILENFITKMQQIHTQSHRDGTIWIWPKYDSKNRQLIWEFIPDETVTDIIKDIDTGEVIAIYTDEELKVSTGYNKTVNVRRTRVFTKTRIEVKYTGGTLPGNLKDKTTRNVTGMLPVVFANNNDGDEIRGYSDLERVLSDLKMYHDINLAESNLLAKFKAKLVQNVNDVNEWLANNGLSTTADLEIEHVDLIFNTGDESTDFAFPERATDAYDKALKRTFKKLVEESGVPEIVWGVKSQGNANTAEEQIAALVQFVKDKQRTKIKPYKELFTISATLVAISENISVNLDSLQISWDDLDAVSDKVKSEIFRNFTQGLASIMGQAGITKEQVYSLWKQNFPKATIEDFEEWSTGYTEAAVRKTLINTDFITARDSAGLVDEMGI